jgi:hypothetical protein
MDIDYRNARERRLFIRRVEKELGIPLGITLCVLFGIRDGMSSVLSWSFVGWAILTLLISVGAGHALGRMLWWAGLR